MTIRELCALYDVFFRECERCRKMGYDYHLPARYCSLVFRLASAIVDECDGGVVSEATE